MLHNTFYKAAHLSPFSFILAKSTIGGNPVDSIIKNNAFVQSGPYSIIGFDAKPTAGVTADYNFVTGVVETHGINGGDPKFQDASNPLGPDGVLFTLDDGLKPLPGSPWQSSSAAWVCHHPGR